MPNILSDIIPDTADDSLLDNLSIGDICRFAKTCKDADIKVHAYIRRKFQVHQVLEQYFTEAEVYDLRRLMSLTGMFISGSTALQFLERRRYEGSDLDLYVVHRNASVVTEWLNRKGYRYVPIGNKYTSAEEHIASAVIAPMSSDTFLPIRFNQTHGYFGAAAVLNFVKPNGSLIQLITSAHCPLLLVLSFHSTCVVNLITHNKAYSVFPKATLEQKKSLIQHVHTGYDHYFAIAKYERRGWETIRRISINEAYNPLSMFAPGPRRLGDSLCWTVVLNPVIPGLSPDFIETNAWCTSFNQWIDIVLDATIFVSPRLEYGYLVAPMLRRRNLVKMFDALKVEHQAKEYIDTEFAAALEGLTGHMYTYGHAI